ncbi:MAG: hypothetical protein QM689_04460 [Oscillospiraceae bacterium]
MEIYFDEFQQSEVTGDPFTNEITLDCIPIIPDGRNYWLIRAKGGGFFDDFTKNNFIAIGYNKINATDIADVIFDNKFNTEAMKIKIESLYPDEKRTGLVAGYIRCMYETIKKGDIVIVPSKNSQHLEIGIVQDDTLYFESNTTPSVIDDGQNIEIYCDYKIRRRVNWVKRIGKQYLDLKFYKALFSHNAISDINAYSSIIDRMIFTVFIKHGELHYQYKVRTTNVIPLSLYSQLNDAIQKLATEFNGENYGFTCDHENCSVKIQVESPGHIEFISKIDNCVYDLQSDDTALDQQENSSTQTEESHYRETTVSLSDFIKNTSPIGPVILVSIIGIVLAGGKIKCKSVKIECKGIILAVAEFIQKIKATNSKGFNEFLNVNEKMQSKKKNKKEG